MLDMLEEKMNDMYGMVKDLDYPWQLSLGAMLFEEIAKANGKNVTEIFELLAKTSKEVADELGAY